MKKIKITKDKFRTIRISSEDLAFLESIKSKSIQKLIDEKIKELKEKHPTKYYYAFKKG